MDVDGILLAMRADCIPEGESGRWTVKRATLSDRDIDVMKRLEKAGVCPAEPHGTYTWLFCSTMETLMQGHGETVMNDFPSELRKHLSFIMQARGRVLVTGLGLGCVVRGLLARGAVDSIDVIERSPDVLRLCAASVADRRVTIHQRLCLARHLV